MAVSVTTGTTKGRANDVVGTRRVTYLRVTLDNAYPTNGIAFDPKAFGHVGKVETVRLFPRFAAGASGPVGKNFIYDHTNKKIFVVVTSTGAEAANGSDQSGCVLDVIVLSD